jgi:hypothetical protein
MGYTIRYRKGVTMTTTTATMTPTQDRDYDHFLQQLRDRFALVNGPLFTTNTDDLYTLFLDALPESDRQHYNCHACRRFVNTFGGLVTINTDGTTQSAIWSEDDTPAFFQSSVREMLRVIQRATVNGVFHSSDAVWGIPVTGEWNHLAVAPSPAMVFNRMTQTPGQARAERREDYGTLQRALVDFTPDMLRTALNLLRSDSLYRSEKVSGVASWLLALQEQRALVKGTRRDNVTWLAVATAPAGFCHPRSSMIGTLLEDIAAGMSYELISKRFAAKMHPLQYQRPQSAPTAGNIAQAEKVIQQLQAANALARRYARLEDIQTIWKPVKVVLPQSSGGVFGHLKTKEAKPLQTITPPAITMTWEKFQRTVLPTAKTIEFYTPHGNDSYAALVTAADPDAPLIFQWNNPVNWYLYHHGSAASDWGLKAGHFHLVTAVTFQPSMWQDSDAMTHRGAGVLFILEDAQDKRSRSAGLALFPETLKAEFHPIRATIEAFSRAGTIADADTASACGLMLHKSGTWKARFRVVTTDGMTTEYQLDRWD